MDCGSGDFQSSEPSAEVLAKALNGKRTGRGWLACCPAHDDKNASLAIGEKDGRTVFKCHTGCPQEAVLAALRDRGLWPAKSSTRKKSTGKTSIECVYDYRDEMGNLIFQTVRCQGKEFRQRRPDGNGGWIWNLLGVPSLPYRNPEILEAIANDQTVFVVEGEKDADNLHRVGIAATCNAGGAFKWKRAHAFYLKDADVVVVPDNDDVGRRHVDIVALSLAGIAKRVRLLTLPGLRAKGDVSDWLENGGSADRLWELVADAPVWEPAEHANSLEQHVLPVCSDEAMAIEFLRRHKHELRYTHAWGKWHLFDGSSWRDDETLLAFDYARAICRQVASEVDPKNQREAKDTASAKKRAAIVSLAREDRAVAATTGQWDRDTWALNTPTGTIDLVTLEKKPHCATDYITRITAVSSESDCPRWCKFIDEITGGDADLAAFLQRMAGYALTGDTSEHALFFLYGTGANGKTVFLSTLAGVFGDYHRGAPIEAFTASIGDRHPTELAMLRGARLVTAVETEEGRRWAESRIKTLTGGDRIQARFMRQDFFEYTPTFKLVIAGNHKPSLRTVDEAIRRRFHLVPFTVTIPANQRVPDLAEKLKAEWPGILMWALDGCKKWREVGLQPPPAVTSATAAYLESEDAVGAWMDEGCERCEEDALSNLYSSWKRWAEQNGEHPRTNKWLSQSLERRGFDFRKSAKGKYIVGLRVATNDANTR